MVLEYILYSWECVPVIILAMLIVPTPENPTAKKCLPSSTLWIRSCWPLLNGFKICIIFLRVCFNNNISHAGSACFPKLSWRKLIAAMKLQWVQWGQGFWRKLTGSKHWEGAQTCSAHWQRRVLLWVWSDHCWMRFSWRNDRWMTAKGPISAGINYRLSCKQGRCTGASITWDIEWGQSLIIS